MIETYVMNFELRGHIVRKAELEKKKSNFLKKTNKLSQRQPAKEQSPDTQRTYSDLRAVKTDGYTKCCAGQAPTRSGQTPV